MSVGVKDLQAGQPETVKVEIMEVGGQAVPVTVPKGTTIGQAMEQAGMGEKIGRVRFNNNPVEKSNVINEPGTITVMGNAEGGIQTS